MYRYEGFEGQFRRTPEQNLSGARISENRDQFLHRAHLERQKREDDRRKILCTIQIQSYARSYLIRKKIKEKHRAEFEQMMAGKSSSSSSGSQRVGVDELNSLVTKLLFFYDQKKDENHLLYVSKLILDKQFKPYVINAAFLQEAEPHSSVAPPLQQKQQRSSSSSSSTVSSTPLVTPPSLATASSSSSVSCSLWLWRLSKILIFNLQLLRDKCSDRTFNSAISLRVLETFTCFSQICENRNENVVPRFILFLKYLIQNKYYNHLRVLIDAKVPPLLDATLVAPTPLSQCLFDLLVTPLNLLTACETCDQEYNFFVMEELVRHLFLPKLSEPLKLYILPALSQLKSFPFVQLVRTISANIKKNLKNPNSPYFEDWSTLNILYVLIYLDKHFSLLSNHQKDVSLISEYLNVIGHSSVQLTQMWRTSDAREEEDEDSDEDVPMTEEEMDTCRLEKDILIECSQMLNSPILCQGIVSVAEQYSQLETVIQPLCILCHNLLMSHKLACHNFSLLRSLAFNHSILRNLYTMVLRLEQKSVFGTSTPLLQVISRGGSNHSTLDEARQVVPLLATFCSLFSLLVATLHDLEFYTTEIAEDEDAGEEKMQVDHLGSGVTHGSLNKMPFSLSELVSMSFVLKNVILGLIELAYPDTRPASKDLYSTQHTRHKSKQKDTVAMWCHLFKAIVTLLGQLHSRDSRKQFCPPNHWTVKQLSGMLIHFEQPAVLNIRRNNLSYNYRPFRGLPAFTREELEKGPPLSTKEIRTLTILHEVPFLVSFEERVLVFQNLVVRDKVTHQSHAQFMQGPSIKISVRRTYIYEDAFDKLSPENEPELRLKMRVQLINAVGMDEAGIDGGGLFREFLSELLKTAFDPKLGFFKLTEDNLLYPNPSVELLHPNYLKHYYFIGRMLGKALYENLLVEIPLADLFLSKLVSRSSDVDIHHLAALDGMLYKNLLYLKRYENVADLGLDFTVLCDELGERKIIELKANGSNIPVTNSNRIEYIHLVADYYLNRRIRAQCNAFKQGLANVISLDWIQMFDSKEFQNLISGAEIPVDVDDLRKNTEYMGGYSSEHETVQMFWKVVDEFDDKQKRQLLKFVTSCSRPPLLGFKELDPKFGIQLTNDEDRLPTASTCMNLLKLPKFQDINKLKDKLLYAISSGAGFELS